MNTTRNNNEEKRRGKKRTCGGGVRRRRRREGEKARRVSIGEEWRSKGKRRRETVTERE